MKWQTLFLLAAGSAAFGQATVLGMEDSVASALSGQPTLQAAAAQHQAVEAKVDQARWDRVGKLETFALYTPTQKVMQIDLPGLAIDMPLQRKYAFQATFTQPLWTWGALSGAQASATAASQASREGLTRAQQQTAFAARRAYVLAAQANEAVEVAEQNVGLQKAFLEAAKARYESGAAPRLDQLKAELAVANAESDLLEARNQDRIAREALATVTFDSRFREARLERLAAGRSPLPAAQDAVSLALKQRPDLAALHGQAEALALGAKAVKAAALPALSFRATILQQDDQAANVFKRDSQVTPHDALRNHQTYQVGLALSWELAGPGRARAKASEIRANERSARDMTRATEEQVALEVRSALFNVQEARERAGVQINAVGVAEEQARVALLAYREGLITSVELQSAELALTAARFNRIRANLDATLALASLRLTLGD